METIRYIHAADLHLDAPFRGLCGEIGENSRLAGQVRDCTYAALDQLIRYCLSEKPDFLVLAGDIYNQEIHSVRAQLALRDGYEKLARLGIRVFWAHGNHDPADSRLGSVRMPENVTIFGTGVESHPLEKDGRQVAIIHGISHASQREERNLARLFARSGNDDCFELGVLHCTVDGESKADRYAPCSLADLQASGLDAWALGHVHSMRELSRSPFVAYSGSAQGLHVNEQGQHGCLLVTARRENGGWQCEPRFLPLGPVLWQVVEIDLGGVDDLGQAGNLIASALARIAEDASPIVRAIMVRLVLKGRTSLDAELRKAGTTADLGKELQEQSGLGPEIRIRDWQIMTRALAGHGDSLGREDLLGETMRLLAGMRNDPALWEQVAGPALAPLLDNGNLRRLLPGLDKLDEAGRHALLDEATRLCTDLLEKN